MTEAVRLTDARLAWLAAKDYCTARAHQLNPLLRVLMVFALVLSAGASSRTRRLGVQQKLMDYGVAVDDLVGRLSADERAILRAAGRLPGWFLPAVDGRYLEVRHRRLAYED